MTVHVTGHAIERYQERVENVPDAEVRRRLTLPIFAKAAEMGCTAVILPTGHRVALEGFSVITVYPRRAAKRRHPRREREE